MIIYRVQADDVMKRHPDYSSVQVEIHDKTEQLYDTATKESDTTRSKERAELFDKLYTIQARAYLRLVDNMAYQEAYEFILRDNVRETWSRYTKTDKKLFDSIGGLDREFLQGMNFSVQHWTTEGHRRIARIRKGEVLPNSSPENPAATVQTSQKKIRQSREPKPELLANPDVTLSRLRAAEALGICSRTLDRWVFDNKLTPVGTGLRKRFKTKDLAKILNQKLLDNRDTK